jgi:metal-responsive CopG/Arc/MetJ family transcriptional regulator
MRIAVSLPESLVRKADRFARRLRKSKSQLYTEAIAEYLARHAPNDITESMNAVCDEIDQVNDGFVSSAARRVLEKEWKPRRNWERKFRIMA